MCVLEVNVATEDCIYEEDGARRCAHQASGHLELRIIEISASNDMGATKGSLRLELGPPEADIAVEVSVPKDCRPHKTGLVEYSLALDPGAIKVSFAHESNRGHSSGGTYRAEECGAIYLDSLEDCCLDELGAIELRIAPDVSVAEYSLAAKDDWLLAWSGTKEAISCVHSVEGNIFGKLSALEFGSGTELRVRKSDLTVKLGLRKGGLALDARTGETHVASKLHRDQGMTICHRAKEGAAINLDAVEGGLSLELRPVENGLSLDVHARKVHVAPKPGQCQLSVSPSRTEEGSTINSRAVETHVAAELHAVELCVVVEVSTKKAGIAGKLSREALMIRSKERALHYFDPLESCRGKLGA